MTPEQIATSTKLYIEGQSLREIAPQVGAHFTTVGNNLRRPEVKAIIEKGISYLMIRGLMPSVRTLTRLAAIGNTKTEDKDLLKLSLDASKTIISHANAQPGTVINALIQVNQAPEQEQAVNLLGEFLQSKLLGKSIPAIQDVNTGDGQVDKSTRGTSIAQSHTPPAIDVQPESVPPPGQVEGMPNSTPKQGTI